jgi:uncharacterized SAM-binding protein YcdF (DUF218 family)
MRRFFRILLQVLGGLTLLGLLAGVLLFFLAPQILLVKEEPRPADAIVLLGGAYSRPLYGADLYNQGYATQILVSRVETSPIRPRLKKIGMHPPTQTELYEEILLRKGVPASAIEFFGRELISTRDEARALAEIYGDRAVTLLVVTSPFHTRRAEIVLEQALPAADVVMLATPYESFPDDWWRHHRLALRVVLEAIKTLYYELGLDFGYEEQAELERNRSAAH